MGGAAFLGGLLGGVSNTVGDRMLQKEERKHALSEEERQTALDEHNAALTNIQSQMQKVHPDTPEWGTLRDQLAQVHADRTALFHPDNGPGAMAHLGRMVWEHVHGKPQPTTLAATPATTLPSTAGVTTPELPAEAAQPTGLPSQGLQTAPSAGVTATTLPPMPGGVQLPGTPGMAVNARATPAQLKAQVAEMRAVQDLAAGAPPAPVNPYTQFHKYLTDAGLSPEDADKAVKVQAGIEAQPVASRTAGMKPLSKPFKGPDGIYRQEFLDTEGNVVSREMDASYTPPPAAGGQGPKVGSFGDFMTAAFGAHPTAQQYAQGRRAWAQSGAGTTSGTHTIQVPQPDGSIKAFTVETTSAKSFGGNIGLPSTRQDIVPPASVATPSVAAPAPAPTPAVLRSRAAAVAAVPSGGGIVRSGEVIGGRLTPGQTKADEAVNAATQLVSTADDAAATPSAAKDKNLALAIIRGAAGRVNMQEFNIMTQRAGLANTLEAWANSATTGQLPADIRKQLVDLAHSSLRAAQAGQAQSRLPPGQTVPTPGTFKQTASGPGGHKIGSNDGGVTWFDVQTNKQVQ